MKLELKTERYWYNLILGQETLFSKCKDSKLNTKLDIELGCMSTQYITKFVEASQLFPINNLKLSSKTGIWNH